MLKFVFHFGDSGLGIYSSGVNLLYRLAFSFSHYYTAYPKRVQIKGGREIFAHRNSLSEVFTSNTQG